MRCASLYVFHLFMVAPRVYLAMDGHARDGFVISFYVNDSLISKHSFEAAHGLAAAQPVRLTSTSPRHHGGFRSISCFATVFYDLVQSCGPAIHCSSGLYGLSTLFIANFYTWIKLAGHISNRIQPLIIGKLSSTVILSNVSGG
jgi:hypothetical protein